MVYKRRLRVASRVVNESSTLIISDALQRVVRMS